MIRILKSSVGNGNDCCHSYINCVFLGSVSERVIVKDFAGFDVNYCHFPMIFVHMNWNKNFGTLQNIACESGQKNMHAQIVMVIYYCLF